MPADRVTKSPRWNIAAAVLQPLGIGLGLLVAVVKGQPQSLIGLVFAVPTYALISLIGMIAAIVALVRNERWTALSCIAFVANVIPFVSMLVLILQKVNISQTLRQWFG